MSRSSKLVDYPVCCYGSGVFTQRYAVQEAALTALWVTSVLEVFSALVGQGHQQLSHIKVSKPGVLLMSQICVASSLPELTENLQIVLIVAKFNLDLIIYNL